jgi:uncharacterized protein YdeI (YjbR/CyaY-like superfamily)
MPVGSLVADQPQNRLGEAKKPKTRERRLKNFVEMLERGEKIHG